MYILFAMSTSSIKHYVILSIIIFINLLFSLKYGLRLSASPVFMFCAFAGNLLPAVLYFASTRSKLPSINKVFQSTFVTWGIPIFIIVLSAVIFAFHETSTRVDRHEMIRLFWDNAFAGKCPYCPRTEGTNIPGPFPFYFFAALPFYLFGEPGYFSLLGIALFAGVLLFDQKLSRRSKNLILIVLVLSPALWWEIACRSTVFLNSAAILTGMWVFDKKYSGRAGQSLLSGILFGLLLSTRSIAFLLVAQSVLHKFRHRIVSANTVVLAAAAGLTFVATFIPVVALCKGAFLHYNPFAVQSSLAPPIFYLVIALVSLWFAARSKDFSALCAVSGGTCFLIVAGYFLTTTIHTGFTRAFIGSETDISYAVLALPFLLYGLGQNITAEKA
jgi:hypothetical protein